jgi:cytochrome c2
MMKSKLLFLALLAATLVHAAPPVEEGKTIFTARCAGCHNVHKTLTGPALAGVDQRRSIDWIVNFVHSPAKAIKGGDTAAVAMFNQFNKIQMPDHPDLTADNIKNVVEYIKTEAAAAPAAGSDGKAPFAKPESLHPAYKPLTLANTGFFLTYFALVGLLVGVLLFAVQLKNYQRRQLSQE